MEFAPYANWEAIAHVIGWIICVVVLGSYFDKRNNADNTKNKKVKTR